MIRLALLLFFVFTFFVTLSASFDDSVGLCCNSNSRPQVGPTPLRGIDIVNESPNYGLVTTPNLYSPCIDSVCYTYFKVDNNTYITFIGVTFCDGSYTVNKILSAELPGYSGVTRHQGITQDGSTSLIYDEVHLGKACPEMRVYYRNFLAGRCDILANLTLGGRDYIHGDSPYRDVSDYCKSQVTVVAESKKLRCTNLVKLPNRLNRCCVTQFNGASCVNANRVLPQDSFTVPDTGNTCQTFYNR